MKVPRAEFERLALEQIDTVDRVARTLTRNSAESDDLVQETYLRALRAWESFDLREHGIRPWLLRILNNLHLTRATREAKQPKAMEDSDLAAVAEFSDGGSEHWEATEDLDRALDQLPDDLRTALTLWAVEGLTYQEIADVVGVPIGTVMSRLFRGRQRLRDLLQGVGSLEEKGIANG